MDKYTETIANNIVAIIKNKLKSLEEQGIKVDIIEPKYSDICLEAKIILNLTNATHEAEAERERFFKENCASVGLKPECYGQIVKLPTSVHEYKVAGLDFHDENPVLLQKIDDNTKFYRISIVDLKKFI